MVATGVAAWRGEGDPAHFSKSELIFPPLQLQRTSAQFLTRAIVQNFDFLCPLLDMLKEVGNFKCVQWRVVADSASANCKALPHLFAYLHNQCGNILASFSPCLLHQLSRILVLNLERQAVSSHLPDLKIFLF